MSTVRLDTTALDSIMRHMDYNTDQMLNQIAQRVTSWAKIYAPVLTGALRSSIDFEKISGTLYHVADGVAYGIYQELGTSRMTGQPFMTPAVEQTASEVPELAKRIATP